MTKMCFTCSPDYVRASETLKRKEIMSDFEPTHQSKHPAGRFYGGVSRKLQNEIDGFDDTDPEQVLNRQDDERDNRFFTKKLDDDVATPCYEQDDDYIEDRFPTINENQRKRAT